MIPSINALRHVSLLLRKHQYVGQHAAIIEELYGHVDNAAQLRLQADDLDQVATMLEEQLKLRKRK